MKDSINISINQIDSISDLIKLHIIKESYFSDIISHQGNMLTLQTGIFSVIVAVVIALSAFFTFQSFNKKLKEMSLNLETIQYTFYKWKIVVDETGNRVDEKYQAYMRGIMRSTAEANNRNPEIAEAMVQGGGEVPGVIDSGKILTFTTSEAIANKRACGEERI